MNKFIKNSNQNIREILEFNGYSVDALSDFKVARGFDAKLEDYINNMETLINSDLFVSAVLDSERPIVVSGDSDVDGILGTVIMVAGLRLIGKEVDFIIPDRITDKRGIKQKQIDTVLSKYGNNALIITVDNGITASAEVDYCRNVGLDIIITDHHQPNGKLNCPVIDPYYNEDNFKTISGAQVAFKLICSLYKHMGFDYACQPFVKDLASLSAITILSDVIMMVGENRLLYEAAISHLNETKEYGGFIRKLTELLDFVIEDEERNFPLRNYNKTNIEFIISPIINSVGRVEGDVTSIVNSILGILDGDIDVTAGHYKAINEQRKMLTEELFNLYKEQAVESDRCIVAFIEPPTNRNYGGIIGLLASKIVEETGRPAIVASLNANGNISASARSVRGFNLLGALREIKEASGKFIMFNGHNEACGGTFNLDDIEFLRDELNKNFDANYKPVTNDYYTVESLFTLFIAYNELRPFGNGLKMPELYYKGNLVSIDKKTYTTRVDVIGKYPIKIYNRDDFNYLAEIVYSKKRDTVGVELVLKIYEDETGEPAVQLVEVLNKNKDIIESYLAKEQAMKEKYKKESEE